MLGDITQAKNVYIVCGRTDMRKGIRGLFKTEDRWYVNGENGRFFQAFP